MKKKVRLFGTVHTADIENTVQEVKSFAEPSDAIFIEEPVEFPGLYDLPTIFIKNPTVFFGIMLYGTFLGVIQYFRSSHEGLERSVAERITSKDQIYPADIDLWSSVGEMRLIFTVMSWGILIVTTILLYMAFVAMRIDKSVAGLFVAIAFLLVAVSFGVFLSESTSQETNIWCRRCSKYQKRMGTMTFV